MLFLKSFKRYKNHTSLNKSGDYCLNSLSSDKPSFSSIGRRRLSSFGSTWGHYPSWQQKSSVSILQNKVSASQTSSNFDLSQSAYRDPKGIDVTSPDRTKKCFWNQTFDKGRLKNFVLWFFLKYGEHKTVRLVEELKTIGFQYATKAGISLGVEDLKIPPKKAALINEAESLSLATIQQFKRGEITEVERFQRLIDTWHRTSEQLKVEVIENFEGTDVLNPVYMMAFSGARGNISQVRQLVGMRGLMSNPQGQIIDYPIRSNFREGLTLTEYIISSYGARKGIVDTALRTANAGYLTRRLVDVAQHVIISSTDCGTTRGIFLNDMKEGNKTIYSLQNRLVGRVLARDIYSQESSTLNKRIKIASKNTEISSDLATLISQHHKKVFVRSPLTCQTNKLVCQLCYGWSLAQGNLVSIGEAVGIVAAQSIGEPGTQLTMRTFHTGGVFAGNISDQIKAPFDGFVIYKNPIAGKLIRTPEGKIAFLTKDEGSFSVYRLPTNFSLSPLNNDVATGDTVNGKTASQNFSPKLTNLDTLEKRNFKIPFYTLLFLRNGEKVFYKQVIAQITSINRQKTATDQAEFTIKAEISGLFYSKNLEIEETKVGPIIKDTQAEAMSEEQKESLLDTINRAWSWGYAWILAGKIYQLPLPSSFFPFLGDFVNKTSLMNCVNWYMPNSFGSGFKLNRPLNFSLFNTNSFKLMRRATLSGSSRRNKVLKSNISLSVLPSTTLRLCPKGIDNKAKISNTSLIEKDFKLLKYDLISFELSKMTYKNIGYFLKLSKPSSFAKLLNSKPFMPKVHQNSFSPWLPGYVALQNKATIDVSLCSSGKDILSQQKNLISSFQTFGLSGQNSILSHQDNLFLFSSLFPRNRFFNTVKTNKSLQTNTRNPLINPSAWEPSFNVFLNWFPKRFFTPTAGLIFFDTNGSKLTIDASLPEGQRLPLTEQQQTASLTALPNSLSEGQKRNLMSVVWPCKTINVTWLSGPRQTSISMSFEARRISTFIVSKKNFHRLSLNTSILEGNRHIRVKESSKGIPTASNTINCENVVKMPSIYIERSSDFTPEKTKMFGFPTFLSMPEGHRRSKKELFEQSIKNSATAKSRATKLTLNKTNSFGQSPEKGQQRSQVIDSKESISEGHRRSIHNVTSLPEGHRHSQGEITFKNTLNKNLELLRLCPKGIDNNLLQTFIYEQYPKNLLSDGSAKDLKATKIRSEGTKNLGYSRLDPLGLDNNGFKFNWGFNLLNHKAEPNKRTNSLSNTGLIGQQSSSVSSMHMPFVHKRNSKQRAFWVPQPFYKIRDKNNSIILAKADIDHSKPSEHLVFVQSNRQGKTRLIELNGNCAQLIFINNKKNGVCLNSLCPNNFYGTKVKNINHKRQYTKSFVSSEEPSSNCDLLYKPQLFKKEAFYKLSTNFVISLNYFPAQTVAPEHRLKSLTEGQRRNLVKRKFSFVTHSLLNNVSKPMTLKEYCKETSMLRKKASLFYLRLCPKGIDCGRSDGTRKLFDLYCYSLFYKKFKATKHYLNLTLAQAKQYSKLYSKKHLGLFRQASTKKGITKASYLLFPFFGSPYLQNQLEQKVNQSQDGALSGSLKTSMLRLCSSSIDKNETSRLRRYPSGIESLPFGQKPIDLFNKKGSRQMFQRLKTVQNWYKKALLMVTSMPFERRQNIYFGLENQNKRLRPGQKGIDSKKRSVSKNRNTPQSFDVATLKNKKSKNLGSNDLISKKTLNQLLKTNKVQLFLEKTRLLKGKTKTEQEKVNNATSMLVEHGLNLTSIPKDHTLLQAFTKQKKNKKKSLQKSRVGINIKMRSAEETNLNLWLTNGYFYYTTDLSKFFLYNKKIIQPGTNIDSHFSFDKNPVYLEIIPLKTDYLGYVDAQKTLTQSSNSQQKGLVTNLLLETKFSTLSTNPNFISKKPEPLSTPEGYVDGQKASTHIALNKKIVIKEQEWLKSFQKDNKIKIIKVPSLPEKQLQNNPNLEDKSPSKKIIELDFSQTILNKNCRFKIEKTQLNRDSQAQSSLRNNLTVSAMPESHKPTNYIILIRKAFEYQFVKEIEYKKDIYSFRLGENPSWQECYPGNVKKCRSPKGFDVTSRFLTNQNINKITQKRAKEIKVKTMSITPSMPFGHKEPQKAYLIIDSRKLKQKMLNQSYHSIRLYSNYKTGLLNKQKTTGPFLSKNGSSQLKLIFNNSLYLKKSMLLEGHRHSMDHCLKNTTLQKETKTRVQGYLDGLCRSDVTLLPTNNQHDNIGSGAETQSRSLKNDILFDQVRSLGNPSLMMTSLKSLNLSPFIISYKAPYSINFPFKTPMCFFNQQYQPSFIFNNPWAVGKKEASTHLTITEKTRNKRLKSVEYATLKQLLSNYLYKINNQFSKNFGSALCLGPSCIDVTFGNKNLNPNLFEIGKNFSNLSSIFVSPIVEYSLINDFPKSIPSSLFEKPNGRNQQFFSKHTSPLDIQTSAILNNRYLRKQNLFLNNSNNKKFLFGKNGPLLGSLASGSPTSNNSFSRFTQTNEELVLNIKKALYKTDFVSYIDNSVNSQIPIMKTYAYSSIKGELIYQKKPFKKMTFVTSLPEEQRHDNVEPFLKPSADSEAASKPGYNLLSIPEFGLSKKGYVNTQKASTTKTQQSPYLTSNKLIRQQFTDFFLSTKPVDHVEYGCMVLTKNDQICYNLSPSRRQEGKQIKSFNQNYKEIYHGLENQKKENQYFINNIVINLLNLLITETKTETDSQQNYGQSPSNSDVTSTPEGKKQNVDKTSKTDESGDSSKFEMDELFAGFLTTEFTNNVSESMSEGDINKLNRENDLNIKKTKSMLAKSGTLELNKIPAGLAQQRSKLLIGEFLVYGDKINPAFAITKSGQIIHINNYKVTLRKGQPIFVSPQAILHKYDGDFIDEQTSVITLAYQQLKTGDIVQGIPKIEQFFEARTTKRGRLFRDSLENLLKAIFNRYNTKLPRDQAVRQSFYKIQQIIIDGVQRVYRSQGVTIADKHLEVIVKQMTSKVRITFGGTTGYLPGELCDLYDIELINKDIRPKILYEPIVLGITKASLEVKSFLSAASFQQTTRVLTKAALSRKTDYLNGLKENVILGNLIPAGTGYLVYLDQYSTNQ